MGSGSFGCASRGSASVHPRLRGERVGPVDQFLCGGWISFRAVGSSPPARGTGVGAPLLPSVHRFIPACAGNGVTGITVAVRVWVHPRLRGERLHLSSPGHGSSGSSPPARGTVGRVAVELGAQRFIPACAGNGPRAPLGTCGPPVHPRLRGERRARWRVTDGPAGSSPPAQGTAGALAGHRRPGRFIPACAGNGHPSWTRWAMYVGSSPPARGTGQDRHRWRPLLRFIPACAGNGLRPATRPPSTPVHPRLRGERTTPRRSGRVSTGSSPPARGTASPVPLWICD